MRAWLLVLVACSKREPPPPAPVTETRTGDAAKLATAELVPDPPMTTPPPVEKGYVRIERLGIDMPAPAGAKVEEPSSRNVIVEWPGCRMMLVPFPEGFDPPDPNGERDPEFPKPHMVGMLSVRCGGLDSNSHEILSPKNPGHWRCLAMCELMKVIPGGPADRPLFPRERPAIVTSSSDGQSGDDLGTIEVWLDGTVRFSGEICEWPRRAKMPAASVENLIAALDRAGVFAWSTRAPEPECCDCPGKSVRVRARGKDVVEAAQCGAPSASLVAATDLINRGVGPNPCASK